MDNSQGKRRSVGRWGWIIAAIVVLITVVALFFYTNFNRLLTNALMKSFNANIVSDVYELKFKNLNVNLLSGNIRVNEVALMPREKPLKDYPAINSSFRLTTKRIILSNVELMQLLRENKLKLEQVEILEPDLQFTIADTIPVFFPIIETKKDSIASEEKSTKRILQFSLRKFDLINANFHVSNLAKQRDLGAKQVHLSINNLMMDQLPGKDLISFSSFNFFVGEISGSLQRDKLKRVYMKDYQLDIDSLKIRRTDEKPVYRFHDIHLGFKELDLQTGDSIFHLAVGAFDLSYKNRSVAVNHLLFEPNISESAMQKRFQYQNTQFAGKIGSLLVSGLNFDTLLYKRKLFIKEISIDSVSAAIFKDKTKPMDPAKFPVYLGQTIRAVKMPLEIGAVKAGNVELVNRERKVDASYATAHINRGTLNIDNITNIDSSGILSMHINAFLEDKVQFDVKLGFDYRKPQFRLAGSFDKFNLTDLNHLLKEYTPAKINKGKVDAIQFSGTALEKEASGTMKFLYHDLDVDLQLKDKAKWKSSVLTFAANTIVASSNPTSPDLPPKEVGYHVERDMHKSFVNIVIKSALAGLKETVLMSKENRKAHKEKVRKAKEAKKK